MSPILSLPRSQDPTPRSSAPRPGCHPSSITAKGRLRVGGDRSTSRWASSRTDAALFFPRFGVDPFEYYRAQRDSSAHEVRVIFPGTLGQDDVGAAISGVQHRYGRLWAVFNEDGDAGAAVRDSLRRRYRVESDRQFTGVRVVLYDTR